MLLLASKTTTSGLKIGEIKECSKNVDIRISWCEGERTGRKPAEAP